MKLAQVQGFGIDLATPRHVEDGKVAVHLPLTPSIAYFVVDGEGGLVVLARFLHPALLLV